MRKSPCSLIFFATGVLLCSPPMARASKLPLPDKEVKTPHGSFVFTELAIESMQFGSTFLLFKVTNQTTRTWGSAAFEVTCLGPGGEPIETPVKLETGRLPPGASESRTSFGIELKGISGSKHVADCAITMLKGAVAASYNIEMSLPTKSAEMKFSGQGFTIDFLPTESGIGFVLSNTGAQPIRIDWNKVSYIGPDRRAQKVMHSGVRYSARSERQEPTVVPPRSQVSETMIPIGGVEFVDGEWKEKDLFPSDLDKAKLLNDTTFGIFLPLEVGSIVKNLSFEFKVAVE